MSDAARNTDIVEMVEYLRATIADIDEMVREWQVKRTALAIRLSSIEAATDPKILEAAADYERRVVDGTPYEDAVDAAELIKEAHRRYVTP